MLSPCGCVIYFWIHHPALFYGVAFLLGLLCHFNDSLMVILPCLSLWLPFLIGAIHQRSIVTLNHLSLSLLTFFTAWGYANIHYSFPSLPEEGVQGMAHVNIQSISLHHSFFGRRWLYRCELLQFFPKHSSQSITSSLPCLIALSEEGVQKYSRPLAYQDYWISGTLLETERGIYRLKVSCKTPWIPVEGSWSLAERRYEWKKSVTKWIETHLSHPLSSSFLAGLATGEFDDHWMRQQFSRFGLQHLLAISGFHFAITAGFLSIVLRLFLSRRLKTLILLSCLGMYCLFLGAQASILRAWVMCSLTLMGELIDKQTTALNSLGIALLAILSYDPLLCQGMGFQLSFATTAAILLFYQPAQQWLNQLLTVRRLTEVIRMNQWNQHGYCLLAFLRQSLALTFAVNAFALPLTLYYFHQFPWMSLLYNVFFPFLASGSLCLLLAGGLFSLIPFFAQSIHALNSVYTLFLLRLIYQVPTNVDSYLVLEDFSPIWLIVYLCCASLGGILWKEKFGREAQQEPFSFL